jgi:hypothetical protein
MNEIVLYQGIENFLTFLGLGIWIYLIFKGVSKFVIARAKLEKIRNDIVIESFRSKIISKYTLPEIKKAKK